MEPEDIIKPLHFEGKRPLVNGSMITASTRFGNYDIYKNESGEIYWSYCFDEYHDEGQEQVPSVSEGIEKANKHWIEQLKGELFLNESKPKK